MNTSLIHFRQQSSNHRPGFTILELLVVMAIVGLLVGLILPAVNSARESARKIQCVNHLHQIGTALHNYHDAYRRLPAGWRLDASRETAFGWGASLLPFLEQSNLASLVDLQSSVDAAGNAVSRTVTPAFYRCPSDVAEDLFTLFEENEEGHETSGLQSHSRLIDLPSANYVGVYGTSDPDAIASQPGDGVFVANRFLRFTECQNGLSNIIMVGERTARKLPSTWLGIVMEGEDSKGRMVGFAYVGPNRRDADECEFDSRHPGCANFLWGDGHVKSISDSIDAPTYRRFATRR
ncbi:hypothetical protein Pan241w_19730 [Gimesia alba]|uniref:DUF1559 domain-containing protein n=1 Tax=Gimesia alba TaxID=2527973 RepID=A0A517RDH7_9PLAN|nr:DUF1559 domain-containing protein [Gimesia alba]QDT41893.1 hypothetical protein Pan241w_19730 [Gimesia alba]